MNLILAAGLSDQVLDGFCSWLCVAAGIIGILWLTTPILSRMTKDIWNNIRPDEKQKKTTKQRKP